jgi:small basic protein
VHKLVQVRHLRYKKMHGETAKFTQISNLMKIPALGAEFLPCGQTDGLTDVTKSIVLFRNFAKTSKNRLLASSYLFVSPSIRSSVYLSACLSVCQNLNSNSAVLARRMFVQFDSVNCWNTPFWLIADNNIGCFTWGSNFHLYWWQQQDIFCN